MIIRDFIYVDLERLKSLYSQVFKGVINTIVETEVNEQDTQDTRKGGLRHPGSSLVERVAEASYKTESKFLYDHMYNLLEQKLGKTILEAVELSSENYAEMLNNTFMVKVHGVAEIGDYQRINTIINQYNDILHALEYVSNFNKVDEGIKEIQIKIEEMKGSKQRGSLRKELTTLKKQLKEKPEYLDKTFLNSLSLITTTFFSQNLEVSFSPIRGPENILFRGILDKQWLRISTEYLRTLYGGYPAPNWTMVGQFTHIPAFPENESEPIVVNDQKKPETIRDAYRTIISAYQGIEKTFTDSKNFFEVIVWPLAIYRETSISDIEEEIEEEVISV